MSANLRETRLCIGVKKQSALQTPLVAADCVTIMKTNPALFALDLRTESDAPWIGKDDEFATQNFLTNWDVSGPIEGYLSSLKAALIAAFALGKVVMTPVSGTGFNYVITPMDPVTDEIEMPATTIVETIRQGASDVIDRALVGMCCEEFSIELNSGPGLQNARISSTWVGCGKSVEPSTITIPAKTTEYLLPGYSVTLTIIGDDYVTAKSIQSASFRWKNNMRLDSGFYPGSGSSDGAQIRGRMEHGDRECAMSVVARFANGSTELAKVKAQTEGTMVLTVTGAVIGGTVYHDLTITLHRVVYRSAVIGDADGIVTVAIEVLPMKHVSNGLVTIEVNTDVEDILTAA